MQNEKERISPVDEQIEVLFEDLGTGKINMEEYAKRGCDIIDGMVSDDSMTVEDIDAAGKKFALETRKLNELKSRRCDREAAATGLKATLFGGIIKNEK